MARQKNAQIPLGELLTKARLDKHMSRAQLSKETGISENSLTRYEKAGLEKDGQFPPSPKLAKLCFTLDISPLTAMFSCLNHDEYWAFKGYTWENWLMDHPDHEYLLEQWFTLVKENQKLSATLNALLAPKPKPGSYKADMLEWMKSEARDIIARKEAFDQRLIDLGIMAKPQATSFHTPGNPKFDRDRIAEPELPNPFDYAAFVKNGSDLKDPSHPQISNSITEAVEAASTKSTPTQPNKKRRGKPDEAV